MKKIALVSTFVALTLIIAIITGIFLIDLTGNEEAVCKLYTYSVSVGEKTYTISVNTNWTSAPEIYLPEFSSKYISVDQGNFMGNGFF